MTGTAEIIPSLEFIDLESLPVSERRVLEVLHALCQAAFGGAGVDYAAGIVTATGLVGTGCKGDYPDLVATDHGHSGIG